VDRLVLAHRGRSDLDVSRLELGAESCELLVVELVLVRERLERLLLDCSAVLCLLQELEDGYVKVDGQFRSLPWFGSGRAASGTPREQPATAD
jgi:hypothetical protein